MDKPILIMMETIRTKLMQRIAMKSLAAEKYVGSLCPKIQKKLEPIMIEVTKCWPKHASGLKYQVACGPTNQHVVYLNLRTCSCKKWELSGIPCMHVVSVVFITGERLEDYVDECYIKSTQMKIYSNFISLISGAN